MPGYLILCHRQVASDDIAGLDPPVGLRIKGAIEAKLTLHPEEHAKPLAYTRERLWALRVGDWRVVLAMREGELWILRIGHRREVNEHLSRRTIPEP